jgi:hypothetical protein
MTRNSGITPRVVQEIFDIFRRRRRRSSSGTGGAGGEEQLKLSFMEVYNERIVDLQGLDISETDEHHSLQITRDEDQGIIVEGAIEVKCRHESDVSTAIGNAIRNRRKREVNLGIGEYRSLVARNDPLTNSLRLIVLYSYPFQQIRLVLMPL